MARAPKADTVAVAIPPPNLRVIEVDIVGSAPLVINRFSQKAMAMMAEKQKAGSQGKKGKAREAKDFDAAFEGARHLSREGWDGFPAGAIRAAMISACRLVGFKMTLAKLSVFVVADGFDIVDGTPLIRITGGEPRRLEMHVRNATGVADIRIRPQWLDWGATLRIRYDADQFSASDVVNLLNRVGAQCGIGEGRPDSKNSAGIGFGTFEVVTEPATDSANDDGEAAKAA